MVFTFKLSKRLARLRDLLPGAIALALSACAAESVSSVPSIVSWVSIVPASDSGLVGDLVTFNATLHDANGGALTGHAVTWTSTDTAVARVDAAGVATYRTAGTTAIVATSEGVADTAAVLVVAPPRPVASVTLAPASDSGLVGDVVAFTVTLRDSTGAVLTGRVVTWFSTDTTVARVSQSGVATYASAGSAAIVATSEGKADTAGVVVGVPAVVVASVTLSPASDSGLVGDVVPFTATLRDASGAVITGRTVTWFSTNTGVARVDTTGTATYVGAGTARIVALSGGKADTAVVVVTAPIRPVASVTLAPPSDSGLVGDAVTFTVTLRDSSGAILTGRIVTWRSTDSTVARVNATGVASYLAVGSAAIIATSEGKADTAAVVVTAPAVGRAGYYAAPNGSSAGDGSIARPWNLATALAGGNGRVLPGDTIWLRGGTYPGAYRSTVRGAAGAPVVVRQYPGERAVIDGAGTASSTSVFYVGGDYTVFWGFEITNSDPLRTTTSLANNVRPNVVSNYASHTRYLNLVVHDGGVAFYNEPTAQDVEIVGCIIFNNGWQAPDRGHGHGLYLKSYAGPVVARDNIVFNQFGYGVHAYTNAGSGQIINQRYEGNVAFNNGTLATNSTSANILLGGADYADADVLVDNLTYFSAGAGGTNVQVGYGTLANGSVTLQNNRFIGGSTVLDVGYWNQATLSGNELVGTGRVVALHDNSLAGYAWTGTQHFRDPLSTSWQFLGVSYPWLVWQATTGLGLSDLATSGTPIAAEVFVRPNPYEAGRANIVVYNWDRRGSVPLDLTGILPVGAQYEIRNVQNLFSAPVASGTYAGGSISLPLAVVPPPAPIGMSSSPAPGTGADFHVFVITVTP